MLTKILPNKKNFSGTTDVHECSNHFNAQRAARERRARARRANDATRATRGGGARRARRRRDADVFTPREGR
jgi:hypothetical protein